MAELNSFHGSKFDDILRKCKSKFHNISNNIFFKQILIYILYREIAVAEELT